MQRSIAARLPLRATHFPPSIKGVWGLGPHVHPRPLTLCPMQRPVAARLPLRASHFLPP